MSVWVVVVYCLVGSPQSCREQLLDQPSSLGFCEAAGQQQAAAWLAEHPAWFLDRVRCAPGERPPAVNTGEI